MRVASGEGSWRNTQFIIVTHNRNTVQVADTVYGITMGADSASQVMGLKLEGERIKAGGAATAGASENGAETAETVAEA